MFRGSFSQRARMRSRSASLNSESRWLTPRLLALLTGLPGARRLRRKLDGLPGRTCHRVLLYRPWACFHLEGAWDGPTPMEERFHLGGRREAGHSVVGLEPPYADFRPAAGARTLF